MGNFQNQRLGEFVFPILVCRAGPILLQRIAAQEHDALAEFQRQHSGQ